MKPLILLTVILILTACDYRTPSKNRFSKACDIEFPNEITVIEDEYQDMGQDYSIIYKIRLSPGSCSELIESIQNSKFYNPNTFVYTNISQDMYIEADGLRAVWARTDNGYVFTNDFNRQEYYVSIDTINLIAEFIEGYD